MVTKNSTWASTGGSALESVISRDGKRIAYNWYLEDPEQPDTHFYTLRVSDLDGSNVHILHQDKSVPWARPFDWSPRNVLRYKELWQR